MSIRKFNPRGAERLLKKSEIKFVNFSRHYINLVNGQQVDMVPVMYRGHMRFAVPKEE